MLLDNRGVARFLYSLFLDILIEPLMPLIIMHLPLGCRRFAKVRSGVRRVKMANFFSCYLRKYNSLVA